MGARCAWITALRICRESPTIHLGCPQLQSGKPGSGTPARLPSMAGDEAVLDAGPASESARHGAHSTIHQCVTTGRLVSPLPAES